MFSVEVNFYVLLQSTPLNIISIQMSYTKLMLIKKKKSLLIDADLL